MGRTRRLDGISAGAAAERSLTVAMMPLGDAIEDDRSGRGWVVAFVVAGAQRSWSSSTMVRRLVSYSGTWSYSPRSWRPQSTQLRSRSEAPAEQLAFAYAQRWEIEIAFAELETHQRGPRAVLRSKSPALVEQEIWGHLCCHYAIRTLMFAAAHDTCIDPDRVSFTAALRITRRSLSQARAFSP